jgi:hypothetical protein
MMPLHLIDIIPDRGNPTKHLGARRSAIGGDVRPGDGTVRDFPIRAVFR